MFCSINMTQEEILALESLFSKIIVAGQETSTTNFEPSGTLIVGGTVHEMPNFSILIAKGPNHHNLLDVMCHIARGSSCARN